MQSKLEGIFQVTGWDEKPYSEESDGAKLTRAQVTQTYTGSIEGESQVEYLMAHQSDQSAVFVGMEKVSASINGKSGSFVIQHNGKFENGVASSNFVIVTGSGQGELSGIEGSGSFESTEGGKSNYQMTINV
ncbi:MAG: DUF3224 domain-containing protein [Planctomycetes bacterium]|nr:DUF3224 domain-containing protein [Planctomycetota bacterium]